MATRTVRKAKNTGQSALAAAQSSRGRDPDNRIGSEVVNRIVSNSSQEFQNYLATAAGQNAMASAATAPPPPVPFAYPNVISSPAPSLMGNAAMDRAFAASNGPAIPPPPFMNPAAVAPAVDAVPPVPFANPAMPLPPTLSPTVEPAMDPTMERLLRYFRLI